MTCGTGIGTIATPEVFRCRNRRVCRLFVLLSLFNLSGCGPSTTYPAQPITLLCPWSAGGGTDRVSRQFAKQLEQSLGIPVNVINATGGSGVTGHTRGAQARPDGYTLTMVTVELNMLHWRGLTSVTYENFQPLHLINRDSAALFVRQESEIQNLDQLRDAIASNPGRIKASGTAFGGIWHVAMAGWLDQQGIDPTAATWISINGSGPSIQELNAGGIDLICCSLPEVDALLAAGKVRCLGVMADERVAGFKGVPTFKEQGHDWSLAGWRGLAAPVGISTERLAILQDAVNEIAHSQELAEFMEQAGFNLSLEGSSEFEATLARQDAIFKQVLTGPAFASMSGEHFGPMLFPGVIGCSLLALLVMLIRQEYQIRYAEGHCLSEEKLEPDSGGSISWGILYWVVAACLLYSYLSEVVGFLLAAVVLVTGLLFLMAPPDRVRWCLRFGFPIALILSVGLYQLFSVGLGVPLPRGWLGW
ncbi:MAG: tripartite tricarboxylate transporter substrate-binding protein [Planctomycetota bacterium]|nr:tripartite tricarboxylate transporter substrate-binding protein [Planctomycetota bacterium]